MSGRREKTSESSRVWRWRHAWAKSDLGANTRNVLGMLGIYMDSDGGSCFPTLADLCEVTRLDKKTVRKHLQIAEMAGWIEVNTGLFDGQKWRRQSYRARWPDHLGEHGEVGEMTAEGGGNDAPKVGEPFPQDKTSPFNSPLTSPSGRADAQGVQIDRQKVTKAFLLWLPTWPHYAERSDVRAKKAWFALTPEQRAACIALTPVYLRSLPDPAKACSPAVYLRRRLWEAVSPEALARQKPETAVAPYCGKLWMAFRLWLLLQPAQPVTLAPIDRLRVERGEADYHAEMRAKRQRDGWPAANRMISAARQRVEYRCSTALMPVARDFVAVQLADERGSQVFAAWLRLFERRGWPLIDRPAKFVYFPALGDLAGDLDGEVEAAMVAFEMRAHEIMNGDAGAKEN